MAETSEKAGIVAMTILLFLHYFLFETKIPHFASSSMNSENVSLIKLSWGRSSPLVLNARDEETKPIFVARNQNPFIVR